MWRSRCAPGREVGRCGFDSRRFDVDTKQHREEDLVAPWDFETVKQLNHYQVSGDFHPFTCPESPHDGQPKQSLVATADGWICPDCSYTQQWAHRFMADPDRFSGPQSLADEMERQRVEGV